MAVYNTAGTALTSIYDKDGNSLQYAYDKDGNVIFSGGVAPFVPTILQYDTNWLITQAWLDNAQTQRDAVKAIYQQSADAVPFFIQTDGHGRYNEGNKGCHNLAEPVMRYIPNIMLGDYASYYNDGADPTNHARTKQGITNYFPVMGNHEFLRSNTDDPIADMTIMVPSFTTSVSVVGSQTYGYYKVLDDTYNVKWLVGQPYIPDDSNSSGFVTKYLNAQWEWFIDEMEADDGYDIIVLNHQPYPGTYYRVATDDTVTYTGVMFNLSPILADRRAKRSGSHTDGDGNTHTYDFTNCQSDLLATFHGHIHKIMTGSVSDNGFASFIGRDMTNAGDCAYGIIDREGGKLHIYPFSKTSVSEPIVLDL